MTKITSIRALQIDRVEQYYLLYLVDGPGQRGLPIWVGRHEGFALFQYLEGEKSGPSMTFDFMATLLNTLDAKVQEVRIEALMPYHLFYAVVKVGQGDDWREVDSRPSDAVLLALHTGAAIFVSDDVMERVAHPLPQPFDEQAWLQGEAHHLAESYRIAAEVNSLAGTETELLTQPARQAWSRMQEEAVALNHTYIGTEHLLLSLMRDRDSVATKTLRELGVEFDQVAQALDRIVGHGAKAPSAKPFLAPRLADVLELAGVEKQERGHRSIGPEHLLLGIVREGNGAALTLLRDLNIRPEELKAKTVELMAA